jgi:hypothetical protein
MQSVKHIYFHTNNLTKTLSPRWEVYLVEIGNRKRAIQIDNQDNVATAIEDIESGESIEIIGSAMSNESIIAKGTILSGHKIALEEIQQGGIVRKYGEPIGIATDRIRLGEHVHTHNLESARAK